MTEAEYPGLPIMVNGKLMPFVLFDITENPMEYDIKSILPIKEHEQEIIDDNLPIDVQVSGYEQIMFLLNQ